MEETMRSIPEFVDFNKKLLREEKLKNESMTTTPTKKAINDVIKCDCCNKEVRDYVNDLYHYSAIIDGFFNKHVHLCNNCFISNISTIPIIVKDKINT